MYLVYKRVQLSHVKEKDFLPTVESPLQESPENQRFHMDPGNNAKDRSDEGCGSGETTATTSLSDHESAEIASSISGGSECTVSFHPESGLPGGETHIPSKDILPLNYSQLSAPCVLEQHQLRTSDNKDREDMVNKVHTFMTEDNNHERNNASNN